MSTRLSVRVATAAALVVSALALTPLGAGASPAGAGTSSSLRSPAWMRHAPIKATPPAGGALTEAELPGATNPSEPFAAASQAVKLFSTTGQPTPVGEDPYGRMSVNPVTGDLSLSVGDPFVPERGVPLGLSLTYNSYFASTNGPFGRGWSFNAGMSLREASDGSVTISQENGSQVTFQHKLSGYVAAPRVIASLREVSGTFVFTRGTRGKNCPRYSRACVKFFFSEPVALTPGHLMKISSPDGGLNLVYNTAGQLTTVKDPAGRTLTFKYASGKASTASLSAQSGIGDATRYDKVGNLTHFTNAGGGSYGFLYDAFHRITGIVDPRGVETDIVYDTAGAVQSITGPSGETDFSRSAAVTSVSHLGGPTSTAHYSEREVTQIDEGDPSAPLATTLYSYDPATLGPTAVTDPDSHTSHMSYDALAHLTSFTDPLSHTSTYHFGAATGIITATDPLGNVSQATTDSVGRIVSIGVDSGDPALTETTTFHYGSTAHPGDVTSVTDPEGHLWLFTYDQFGNQTSSTDPLGDLSTVGYDRMGRPAINTLPRGYEPGSGADDFSTTYTYDLEGRMLSSTDPLGNTESFSYDLAGNLISAVAGGHQTSYGYDAAGRWTVVTRPSGSQSTLSYLANGDVGEQCDDGNACEEYTYDDLGRPHTVTDQLGNTSSFVYSPGGLLLSSTDAKGVTTSYTHDADGRTTGVSYSDGVTHPVTYHFDADGRLDLMTDGTGTTSFTHDSLGRLTTQTSAVGPKVTYGYDQTNHELTIAMGLIIIAARTYDPAGRMTSVTDRLGNTTTFSYDASSNLTQTLFPGGDIDRDGYDNAERLLQFSVAETNTSPASLDIAYTRNLLGQITRADQTGTGQPDQGYSYDVNGRVSLSTVSQSPVSVDFDSRNNLLQDASGDTFTYDAADRLVSEEQKNANGNVNWQFGFDDNGSRTSASTLDGSQSESFGWDAAGNLTSVTDGSTSETNTYDGLGRRVSSSAGGVGHTVVWDSSRLLSVWASTHATPRMWAGGPTDEEDTDCGGGVFATIIFIGAHRMPCHCQPGGAQRTAPAVGPLADGNTVYLYGPEGLPVEQVDGSGNALFYHHDQLGSTRAVTDDTGHTVEIVAYDTWGNEAYHSGTVSVPFGFGGGFSDSVGHAVLIGHDYYDPPTGQFLSKGTQNSRAGGYASGEGNERRGITDSLNPNAIRGITSSMDAWSWGIGRGITSSMDAWRCMLAFTTGGGRGIGTNGNWRSGNGYVDGSYVTALGDGNGRINRVRVVFSRQLDPTTIGTSRYAFAGGDPINHGPLEAVVPGDGPRPYPGVSLGGAK